MPSNAVSLTIDAQQFRQAEAMLRDIPKAFPLALSGAVNETLKETETGTSKAIRAKVNIKRKDLDPHLVVIKAKPSPNPAGRFTIKESQRISLSDFGAKQTPKGVTYKIGKTGSRSFIQSAFGPPGVRAVGQTIGGRFAGVSRFVASTGYARLGNQVFRRAGKSRLPLVGPLKGPSAWGVVVKNQIDTQAVINARASLEKNLQQRVAFYIKKHAGLIPGFGPGGVPARGAA